MESLADKYKGVVEVIKEPLSVPVARAKVIEAFKNLRKEGFIARANFSCCGNCAGHEIAGFIAKKPLEEAEKIKGCMTWNRQSEESFQRSGELYIGYGPVYVSKYKREFGLSTEKVGKALVAELEKQGLDVVWNGNPNTRIVVKAEKPPRRRRY